MLVGYSYVLGIIDGSPAVLWASPWTWQAQLTWIGKILGLDTKAAQLLTTIRSQADDLKNQNAKLNGKSLQAMTVTDDGVNQVLDPSNTASYLEGLGLRYNDALGCNRHRRHPSAGADRADQSDRHRRASGAPHGQDAGGGGFAGLPQPFSYCKGLMIIVDKPDVIAAFADPGGYLATEYLNANFVPDVARQVG